MDYKDIIEEGVKLSDGIVIQTLRGPRRIVWGETQQQWFIQKREHFPNDPCWCRAETEGTADRLSDAVQMVVSMRGV